MLAAHTRLLRSNTPQPFHPTLQDICEIWHSWHLADDRGKVRLHHEWNKVGLFGYSVIDERVKRNRLVRVIFCGVQDVHRITLEDDTIIDCTRDHLFNMEGKVVKYKKLKVGKSILYYRKDGPEYFVDSLKIFDLECVGQDRTYDVEFRSPHNFLLLNGVWTI